MKAKEFKFLEEKNSVYNKVLEKFDEINELSDDKIIIGAPFVGAVVRKLEKKKSPEVAEKLLELLGALVVLIREGEELYSVIAKIVELIKQTFKR